MLGGWRLGSIPLRSTKFGLKVFMDAHEPVTLEEGDRYPLGPPNLFRDSTAVVQLAVNQLVVGSIPTLGASNARFVYRSGHLPFTQVRGVRFPYRVPSMQD